VRNPVSMITAALSLVLISKGLSAETILPPGFVVSGVSDDMLASVASSCKL